MRHKPFIKSKLQLHSPNYFMATRPQAMSISGVQKRNLWFPALRTPIRSQTENWPEAPAVQHLCTELRKNCPPNCHRASRWQTPFLPALRASALASATSPSLRLHTTLVIGGLFHSIKLNLTPFRHLSCSSFFCHSFGPYHSDYGLILNKEPRRMRSRGTHQILAPGNTVGTTFTIVVHHTAHPHRQTS